MHLCPLKTSKLKDLLPCATVFPSPASLLAAPEGVARGPDALSLLEYPETRNQFIDELMEVPPSYDRRAGDLTGRGSTSQMSSCLGTGAMSFPCFLEQGVYLSEPPLLPHVTQCMFITQLFFLALSAVAEIELGNRHRP